MDEHLAHLLGELAEFGRVNDEQARERSARLLNITPDTGRFLSLLIHALRPQHVVEIGTSNGYSTLWLADAAREVGGRVSTVEHRAARAEMAAANFARAGLAPFIEQRVGEAGPFLAALPECSVQFLFLDAERYEYPNFWPDLQRALAPNGLIVADNAVSHAAEMAPFVALVEATSGFPTSLVPVGKGELLILKPPA